MSERKSVSTSSAPLGHEVDDKEELTSSGRVSPAGIEVSIQADSILVNWMFLLL